MASRADGSWINPDTVLDPTTAAFIQAGSSVLGSALESPGNPSRADSSAYASFDSSGFAVSFGSGGISQTQPISIWLLLGAAVVGLIYFKLVRKS